MSETSKEIIEDEEEREIVEIALEDLESIVERLDDLEAGEDIMRKIERSLVEDRVIYLSGEITQETVDQVVPMIHYYNIQDRKNGVPKNKKAPIKIYLNSVGGEMIQGKAILSAMENSSVPIETISEGGTIASMGFILFLGGHTRKMSRHADVMYHTLSAGTNGTLSEMANDLEYFKRLQKEVDGYIVERTSIPLKKLRSYGKRNLDWRMSFEECSQYDIFDEVL